MPFKPKLDDMNKWPNWIIAFFNRSQLWVFLTMLLFSSYVMLVITDRFGIGDYLFYFLSFSLLYLPTLLFVRFREQLLARFSRWPVRLIAAFCFLGWPWIVSISSPILGQSFAERLTDGRMAGQVVFLGVGVALLLTELTLYFGRYFDQQNLTRRHLTKRSLERLIGWVVIILVLLFTNIAIFVESSLETEAHSLWFWIQRFVAYFIHNLLTAGVLYIFYYLNHYWLIPQVLRKRGFISYGFAMAGAILVFYPLINVMISWLPSSPLNDPELAGQIFPLDRGFYPFMIMLLSTPFIIGLQWFQQSTAIAELERERSRTELDLLKQQINPHFFFNTLNNLYALSLTKDKATPEVVLQLSELMRYVIYKGQEEVVPLREDIKYMADYVELQRIRLHKQLDYRFEQTIEDPELLVPPLLFITLVENAFKHGIEPAEEDCFLHIRLTSEQGRLQLHVHNSVEGESDHVPGIGLANLERRLELLFPDRHHFRTERTAQSFTATLEIEL